MTAIRRNKRSVGVEKTVTVNTPREEVYRYWRQLDHLPRFMSHLESVTLRDAVRSHWIAKGAAGTEIEWDAEIINEIPNELLAWQSTAGSAVSHAGSARFMDAPAGRGTEVHVVMRYDPPGGILGAAVAKLFGDEPSRQITEDLRRFKQLLEAGEIPTTEGQSSGRAASRLEPEEAGAGVR